MHVKLPQSLRQRLVPLFKEILAYQWIDGLTFNRLSGAVFNKLVDPSHAHLSEDQAVDLAVNLTRRDPLPKLLEEYDRLVETRRAQAQRQVLGVVQNLVAKDTPNRDQVIEDTLAMLEKFPLVRSITGIRKLVQARIENGHKDVDEDDYLFLS